MTRQGTRWSDEEIQYLKNNHMTMSAKELAEKLNRTRGAVYNQRKKLGLVEDRYKVIDKQIEFITKNYTKMTRRELAEELNISKSAVNYRMGRLGLASYKKRKWTEKEDKLSTPIKKDDIIQVDMEVLKMKNENPTVMKIGDKKYILKPSRSI